MDNQDSLTTRLQEQGRQLRAVAHRMLGSLSDGDDALARAAAAIFTALATSSTSHLLAAHTAPLHPLNSGLQEALLASAIFVLAAAVIGLRTTNTLGEQPQPAAQPTAEPAVRSGRARAREAGLDRGRDGR
jgi:hypothetical protein